MSTPPPLLVRAADGSIRWAAPAHDAASAPAGTHGGATLPTTAAVLSAWEAEADAVYILARAKLGLWGVDASRRVLEAAPRTLTLRYYERWVFCVTTLLIECGVLTNAEVESGLASARGAGDDPASAAEDAPARFAAGDAVTVLCDAPGARWRTPHVRTPGYAQGRCGVIERVCGVFDAPEERAWRLQPVRERLYRVAFPTAHLFPDGAAASNDASAAAADDDAANAGDTTVVEIFERWLERADAPATSAEAPSSQASVYEALLGVVKALLIAKGILSQADVDAHVAAQEALRAGGGALGGRLVAAAWCDAAFKARLLADASAAAAELGISTAGIAQLIVLENTPQLHNLVVCSLCSCYPRPILGPPPEWYKSWEYRAAAVREPRRVLAEWGVVLPANCAVAVHDSSADCRYLVLPLRPRGTDGWEEARLAALVTSESLVGVATLPAQGAEDA